MRGEHPPPRVPPPDDPPPPPPPSLPLPYNPFHSIGRTAKVDTGAEYGDINDTNMEGEETLENIDYFSLKIFPCLFLLFNIIFWATFLSGQIRY